VANALGGAQPPRRQIQGRTAGGAGASEDLGQPLTGAEDLKFDDIIACALEIKEKSDSIIELLKLMRD